MIIDIKKFRYVIRLLTLAILCVLWGSAVYAKNVNVKDFGAVGDGATVDTPAINKAIAAAARSGGGTVYFPAGTYLSFSIHLKSNVSLYIDQGATILAADPEKVKGGYDPAEPNPSDDYQDYGHSHWHDSLIWGVQLENISILGPGKIDGSGLVRWDKEQDGIGNKAIALKNCHNVIIRDITLFRGGHFAILATGVDILTIDNMKIDTNRDGIDVDACKNVRISNCTINSPYDDAIVLKSSYALGYARITENVSITNSQVSGYDVGTLLDGTYQTTETEAPDHGGMTGRIKLGTESNGGYRNITISNCVFDHCRGLALETVDGGLLEDITVSNITMRDLTSAPFFFRLGSRMRGPDNTPVGTFRGVNISNVVVYGADPQYGSIISGIPGHSIQDISLNHIQLHYNGGGTAAMADLNPPENADGYPDPSMFGKIPAYGFYLRHVDGINMTDVEMDYMQIDQRPPLQLNDVNDARFHLLDTQHTMDVPFFKLKKVSELKISQSRALPDTVLRNVTQQNL